MTIATTPANNTDGTDQVVVLIRLPHLGIGPQFASNEDTPAQETTPTTSIVTPPPDKPHVEAQDAVPAMETPKPVPPEKTPAQASVASPDCAHEPQPVPSRVSKPAFDPMKTQRQLGIPQHIWQLGAALSIMILVVVAILSINSSSNEQLSTSLNDTAAGSPHQNLPELPLAGFSDNPDERLDYDIMSKFPAPPAPPQPAKVAKQPPEAESSKPEPMKPAKENAEQVAANVQTPATPPAKTDAADFEKTTQDVAAAAEAKASKAAETPKPATSSTDSAVVAETPKQAAPSEPSGQDLAQNEASAGRSPLEQASQAPSYPSTSRTTYQYPSDYERLFHGAVENGNTASTSTTTQSGQRSIYDRPINTARLNTQIEAPPLR